ncbi:MAG TPA: Fe-S cluster assembly ATPase SufC [Actinomycetota bacterium]|jgi:Fe-S cluster assembly ATP-binding protein|nr:Fe-S cluster assembly ATPase SufC [Actinomycetota bacterium]
MSERNGAATLEIKDLRVSVDKRQILEGVDLTVRQGEVHALMGPNGSGKSTLAGVIMGRPGYRVTGGDVLMNGESVLKLTPDKRARLGLFLAFQYPVEVPGVSVVNFLRSAYNSVKNPEGDETKKVSALAFRKLLKEKMGLVGVEDDMVRRYVNQGFSGGEKKKMEVLQLAVLEPQLAVLDETDSGLDIDALKSVAGGIEQLRGPDLGLLLITHYQRILNYVQPDHVHVLMGGRIVRSGGPELAKELEEKGYEGLRSELGIDVQGDEAEGHGGQGGTGA